MQGTDTLGFRSKFTLLKLGYDLRDTLRDTVEAPVPEALEAQAQRIADREGPPRLLLLSSDAYRVLDDRTLM